MNPMRETTKRAIEMFNEAKTSDEVASALGISKRRAAHIRYVYRADGRITHDHIKPAKRQWPKRVRFGQNAKAQLMAQDEAFLNWLIGNTPKGATVMQTLIAMALDTYHEEMS